MSSFKSGQCAFCGADFCNTPSAPIPLVVVGSPSDDPGTVTKLKPLRWRFLTNTSSCTKFLCTTCADKRQVPQQTERPESWPRDRGDPTREHVHKPPHHREERDPNQPRSSGRATRFEHMDPQNKACHQRRVQNMSQNIHGQRLMVREPSSKHCDSPKVMHEPLTRDGRRRRSMQPSESPQEAARRCSLQQQYAIRHVSKESVVPNRPARVIEGETQPSMTKRRASAGTTPRRRSKASDGHSEPRRLEPKDQRLSTTADILGMSRALELPPNYFDMSSSSPKFSAMRPPEQDRLDCRQKPSRSVETRPSRRKTTTAVPNVEPRKQNETEEERERRRSASYARMLLRMQRHYDAVQANASPVCPTTAPPRRIRTKRQEKLTAVRDVKDDPTNFAIDLEYLSAYKDAR